jgi:hypothetical protein
VAKHTCPLCGLPFYSYPVFVTHCRSHLNALAAAGLVAIHDGVASAPGCGDLRLPNRGPTGLSYLLASCPGLRRALEPFFDVVTKVKDLAAECLRGHRGTEATLTSRKLLRAAERRWPQLRSHHALREHYAKLLGQALPLLAANGFFASLGYSVEVERVDGALVLRLARLPGGRH